MVRGSTPATLVVREAVSNRQPLTSAVSTTDANWASDNGPLTSTVSAFSPSISDSSSSRLRCSLPRLCRDTDTLPTTTNGECRLAYPALSTAGSSHSQSASEMSYDLLRATPTTSHRHNQTIIFLEMTQ